jgi:hypothetical protein
LEKLPVDKKQITFLLNFPSERFPLFFSPQALQTKRDNDKVFSNYEPLLNQGNSHRMFLGKIEPLRDAQPKHFRLSLFKGIQSQNQQKNYTNDKQYPLHLRRTP